MWVEGVLVRPVEPDGSGVALVSWDGSGLAGRAAAVYVNGRLYDAVMDGSVGELWIEVDRVRDCVVELESGPVSEAWVDRAAGSAEEGEGFRLAVEAVLVRDERLSVGSEAVLTVDGLEMSRGRVWGGGDSRSGFGGLLGVGAFGLDLATGPGWGMGESGVGPWGTGGEAWRWRSEGIEAGVHGVEVWVEGESGELEGATSGAAEFEVDEAPERARGAAMSDEWVLSWS